MVLEGSYWEKFYKGTSACVRVKEGLSEFSYGVEVKQGCVVSP